MESPEFLHFTTVSQNHWNNTFTLHASLFELILMGEEGLGVLTSRLPYPSIPVARPILLAPASLRKIPPVIQLPATLGCPLPAPLLQPPVHLPPPLLPGSCACLSPSTVMCDNFLARGSFATQVNKNCLFEI